MKIGKSKKFTQSPRIYAINCRKYKRGITGIVISKVNRGLGSSFTIRNVIEEVAFEMTFQLYHPLLVNVEVVEHNRRRRAKLYYLRHKNDNHSTFSQALASPAEVPSKPRKVKARK
eukprot:m.123093 g.123093  ORF g.123093 m.123093 type:complete len:116 (+) comp14443_c2_seq5:338-685(+)